MEKYNLSDQLKNVMNCFDEHPYGIYIEHSEISDIEFMLNKIYKLNNDFLKKTIHKNGIQYTITDFYEDEINYLYEFFLLCESLLNNDTPNITRFNEAKLRDLKAQNIVSFSEVNCNIKNVNVNSFNLLEDEYFNMRYKVSNKSFNSINKRVNISDSTYENSNIQINCSITENDLIEIVQSIQVLIAMNAEVPQRFKNELANNIDNKNKLRESLNEFVEWLDTTGITVKINASVLILTNIAVKTINNMI